MRGWRRWIGPMMVAGAVGPATLAAQGSAGDEACSLATAVEFQTAYEYEQQIGIIPDTPTQTEMVWGPHCDYADGAITLFTKKTPSAELERVLTLTKAGTRRDPVSGLGQRAFFTVIYPGDQYREQGLLAVFLGSRIVTFSMDAHHQEPVDATRPRLERLAKLVLPRVK